MTNTTAAEIAPTAARVPPEAGCDLSFDPAKLPANEFTEVTLKVPAACKVEDDGVTFTVDADPALAETLTLSAAPKTEEPDWDVVAKGFKVGLLGALLVIFLAQLWWWAVDRKEKKKWQHLPWRILDQLDDKWSFKDSWVANLTLAGALLATLLGNTEVIKSALGEDSDNAIALITLSAGVGAALLAVGQIWVLTWKRGGAGGWKKGGWVTVFGLYGGAVFTLTGAFGEMWIVTTAAESFDLGNLDDLIKPFAWFAATLLGFYAIRTLVLILEMGTNPPAEAPTDDSKLLVAAVLKAGGTDAARIPRTIDSLDAAFKSHAEKKKKAAQEAKQKNKVEREEAKEEDRDPNLVDVPSVAGSPTAEPQRSARARERTRSPIL